MSPGNVTESDKVTLVTSDGPPQRYIVSRSKLMLMSGFFLDRLSSPTIDTDEDDREINLTEKAAHLQGFLAVVQGEEVDEMLSTLDYDDWISLGRLASKFECRVALKEVLLKIWKLIADDNDFSAFFLALAINDKEVLQKLSLRAIDEKWHQEEECPQHWTKRLDDSYKLRLSQVRNKLFETDVDFNPSSTGCTGCRSEKLRVAWNDAAYTVMLGYRCSESVEDQIRKRLEINRVLDDPPTICEDCVDHLCSGVEELEDDLPSELEIDFENMCLHNSVEQSGSV